MLCRIVPPESRVKLNKLQNPQISGNRTVVHTTLGIVVCDIVRYHFSNIRDAASSDSMDTASTAEMQTAKFIYGCIYNNPAGIWK